MAGTLAQLRPHYLELFILVMVLQVLTIGTMILLATIEGRWPLAVSLSILSILFIGYVAQRELTIRKLSHQVVEEKLREVSALHRSLETMTAEQRPEKALETILGAAMTLCGAARGSIMLVDEPGQQFIVAVSRGINPQYLTKKQRLDEGVAGQVVASGQPQLITKPIYGPHNERRLESLPKMGSSLCVPLRINEIIIGVLNCSGTGTGSRLFTQYDLELMTLFGSYAALVLERARSGARQKTADDSSSVVGS